MSNKIPKIYQIIHLDKKVNITKKESNSHQDRQHLHLVGFDKDLRELIISSHILAIKEESLYTLKSPVWGYNHLFITTTYSDSPYYVIRTSKISVNMLFI